MRQKSLTIRLDKFSNKAYKQLILKHCWYCGTIFHFYRAFRSPVINPRIGPVVFQDHVDIGARPDVTDPSRGA